MGVYASLGVTLAITCFTFGVAVALLTQRASRDLHHRAITTVMHAPMGFFETTPLGRIMNRFSKDIDGIDNAVSDSMQTFLMSFSNVIGTFAFIAAIIPWFLVPLAAIMVVYYFLFSYYRESSRQLKRLAATLRSPLYAHFSESLTGVATIRAYGETERFRTENENRMNIENRYVCAFDYHTKIPNLLLQGLLANGCESTLASYASRRAWFPSHFRCSHHHPRHPVLHFPLQNWSHTQLYHHYQTSSWTPDS